ncbi:hypothetical protein N9K62_04330 [Candidatus Pelagibacter bacterium]|nr:hypothetical protein [Candidatus Pelagibacter bacterium]
MNKINYIAFSAIPSVLPSSLQIVKTCDSFSKHKYNVTLIKPGTGDKRFSLKKYYGLQNSFKIKEFKFFKSFPKGLKFYLYSLCCLFFIIRSGYSVTITRNYFICYLLLLFRKKVILEIHHDINIEGRITKFIIKNSNFLNKENLINIIAITNSVKNLFVTKYHVKPNKIKVLPSGSSMSVNQKPTCFYNRRLKIGYFGSLSLSKGIQTLVKLSKIDKENDYYIYGGTQGVINNIKKKNNYKNLFLSRAVPYANLANIMTRMDLLTIPYKKKVSSAGEVDDISKYTSPLKLFDYLAVGKVIIASDLKVFREVISKKNAFFVKDYENIFEWRKIIRIAKNNKKKLFIMSKNNFELSKNYEHLKRVKNYFK